MLEQQLAQRKKDLVLAQRIIGLVNMGLIPSSRLVDHAHDALSRLQHAERLEVNNSSRVLGLIQRGVMVGQTHCRAAINELSELLKPLRQELRERAANDPGANSVVQSLRDRPAPH